jgi:hypothetical protein
MARNILRESCLGTRNAACKIWGKTRVFCGYRNIFGEEDFFFCPREVPLAQKGPIFSIFLPFEVAQKRGKLKSIEILLQKCYQGC